MCIHVAIMYCTHAASNSSRKLLQSTEKPQKFSPSKVLPNTVNLS